MFAVVLAANPPGLTPAERIGRMLKRFMALALAQHTRKV